MGKKKFPNHAKWKTNQVVKGQNQFVVFLNLDRKQKLVGTHLLERQKSLCYNK
jgi:hypothetical protein